MKHLSPRKNVCSQTIQTSIYVQVTLSYTTYEDYYTRCGFLWLSRCKKSRYSRQCKLQAPQCV